MKKNRNTDLFYPETYTDGLYKKICRRLDRLCLAILGASPFRECMAGRAGAAVNGLDVLTSIDAGRRYTLAAVAIARDEQDYILEWVEFHRLVGFEHFFIYDNSEHNRTYEQLKGHIDRGLVTYIRFPDLDFGRKTFTEHHKLAKQELAYGDCISRFSTHIDWLMQIDLDEFCFPTRASGTDDLRTLLMAYREKGWWGIEVNMLDFGNSFHERKPEGLVIENFRHCSNAMRADVKSIARTSKLSYRYYSRTHHFIYKYHLFSHTLRLKILSGDAVNRQIRLNHYVTKSLQEFLQHKTNRTHQRGKYTQEKFNEVAPALNAREDDSDILRFIEPLKTRLTEYNNW